jgi:endonuclease-3 related protein
MGRPRSKEGQLRAFYLELARVWGAQQWWPARSRFEMIVGAYLTQNTAWTNVERALANLRSAHRLSVAGIRRLPLAELERLIRPAGYFRQKAQRLKTFIAYLDTRYQGSFRRMFAQSTALLRQELLALHGVGPETADAILLYAGHHPVFVVDAYTRRILDRHDILPATADYEEIRELFESSLWSLVVGRWPAPDQLRVARGEGREERRESRVASHEPGVASGEWRETAGGGRGTGDGERLPGAAHLPSPMSTAKRTPLAQIYNEMHALLVGVGKNHCFKSKAHCEECPLQIFLEPASPQRTRRT